MSERTQGLRRSRLALSVILLAALPGCAALASTATAELWRGYEWPDPVMEEQLVDRQTRSEVGTLVPLQHVLEYGLWWCAGEDCSSWRWWLRPEFGGGTELAAALLADPDFCTVDAAAIDAVRGSICDDDEVLTNQARLELEGRLHSEAIGHAVSDAEISPAAARELATTRRNAYMLAADPGAGLPAVYRDCLERLPAVDLGRLVGASFEVRAEAWVFVGDDGQPAFQDGTAAGVLPAGDADVPLADRLTTLGALSLLVRIGHGDDSTILRLRPDRLWLLSGLDAEGDHFVHRSYWHLQAAPLSLEARPAVDAARWRATLRLRENQYQRSFHPVLIDGEFLVNVALTPVALAFDVFFGPGGGDFLRWLTGKPPPRGEPQQRRN